MMSLLASVFTGFGMIFSGLFGGHHAPPAGMASTTPTGQMMSSSTMQHMGGMGMEMGARMQGVTGKITSVSGSSFTMTGFAPGTRMSSTTAPVTYTVDASSAKVFEFSKTRSPMTGSTTSLTETGTLMSVSNLAVGDRVLVTGPVSGTSITASTVVYGIPEMQGGMGTMHGMRGHNGMSSSSSMMVSSGN